MFYYLDGTVAEILPGLAVIDCGGVGYACMTTNNTLSPAEKGGKEKALYLPERGESVFDLYGFASQNELNSFKLLLGVSGVGPKAALAILSANTPEGLAMAIVTEDAKSLTAAQGIGRKIAQRIILELKDKMAKGDRRRTGLFRRQRALRRPPCLPARPRRLLRRWLCWATPRRRCRWPSRAWTWKPLPLEEIIRQSLKKMVK